MDSNIKIKTKIEDTFLVLSDGTVHKNICQKIRTHVQIGIFDMGTLQFECVHCHQQLYIDMNIFTYEIKNTSYFHIDNFTDKDLLHEIGEKLFLQECVDKNGEFLGYKIDFIDHLSFGPVMYYKCSTCQTQYLILFSTEGDPGRIHFSTTIHSVWQIEVDEAYFLQFFNKPLY